MKNQVDLLIKNAKVVLENRVTDAAVAVKDERIVAIADQQMEFDAKQVIDAQGRYLMPGAVDPHAHIWEPTNYPEREDWFTGTQAAAAGGVTTLVEMPLSVPPVTDPASFNSKDQLINSKSIVDYALWGALCKHSVGNFEQLHECGCTAYKGFTPFASPDYPHVEDYDLLQAMAQIKQFDGLVGIHAENADIVDKAQKYYSEHGPFNGATHNIARPEIAEIEAIQRVLLFAKETGVRIHICHVSTAKAWQMVERAKQDGVRVTIETCPHYLVMDTDDLDQHGGFAKCNPPLRTPENREQLWQMVLDGRIDMIGTDHTPYTDQDRLQHGEDIFKMPPGIGGMDLMVPLMLDEGVNKRGLSMERLAKLLSTNPAKVMGLYPQKGVIAVGSDADFALVDLNKPWTYSYQTSYAKAKCENNPYEGRKLQARVEMTFVRGRCVFDGKDAIEDAGYGQLIRKGQHYELTS